MIGYLEGTVLAHTNTGIILLVGSVGYDILGVRLQSNEIGSSLSLFTHLAVGSDNQPTLIGFIALESRVLFRQFLKVPGIGPKTALSVIDSAPLEDLKNAILEGDITFFTRVKGLGKKAAQKIILELKNQLVEPDDHNDSHTHIYAALTSLKFSRQEISEALKEHDLTNLSESDSIRIVLQSMGK